MVSKENYTRIEENLKTSHLSLSHSLPLDDRTHSDSNRSDLSPEGDIPQERDAVSEPYSLSSIMNPTKPQMNRRVPRISTLFEGHMRVNFDTEETTLAPPSTPFTPAKNEAGFIMNTDKNPDTEEKTIDRYLSPLTDSIYFDALHAAEICLGEVLRMFNMSKGWKLVSDRDGIRTEKFNIGNKDSAVKVKSKISCESNQLLDFLKDAKNTQKWDKNLLEGLELKSYEGDLRIIYMRYKQPKLIEDRDFVLVTKPYSLENGLRILIAKSVDLVKHQGSNNKAVRADIIYSGFIIEERGVTSEVTHIAQVDPKGSIPKWLSNKVTKYHSHKLKALRSYFRTSYKKLKTIS